MIGSNIKIQKAGSIKINKDFYYAIDRENITSEDWINGRIELIRDLGYDGEITDSTGYEDIMESRRQKQQKISEENKKLLKKHKPIVTIIKLE